jgi:hypothetical protein
MDAPDVYSMLARRFYRGFWICRVLYWVSVIFGGLVFIPGYRSWAVVAFIAGVHFYIGWTVAARKIKSASCVSENPQHVYWVRATTIQPPNFSDTFITLHLRDGSELEVGLSKDQIRRLVDWLAERNPSLRVGAFDDSSEAADEWQ